MRKEKSEGEIIGERYGSGGGGLGAGMGGDLKIQLYISIYLAGRLVLLEKNGNSTRINSFQKEIRLDFGI